MSKICLLLTLKLRLDRYERIFFWEITIRGETKFTETSNIIVIIIIIIIIIILLLLLLLLLLLSEVLLLFLFNFFKKMKIYLHYRKNTKNRNEYYRQDCPRY